MATIKPFNPEDPIVGKNLAIKASAGTGKTYNIIKMLENLLSNNLNLKDILIVTYTEKAAEELKNRIRTMIDEKGFFNNDINSATIGTIHSFCQKTIEEYCIASNKPSNLKLINESECENFAKQYLRTPALIEELECIKKYIFAMTDKRERNPDIEDSLIKYFVNIVEKYYLTKNLNEDSSIVSLWSLQTDIIQDAFDFILSGKDMSITGNNVVDALNILQRSTNTDAQNLYNEIINNDRLYFKNLVKAQYGHFNPTEISAYENLKSIKKTGEGITKRNTLLYYFAYKHAGDFLAKWYDEKNKKCYQTFNDMIRIVREEIVSNGPLLTELKKRYKLCIIDEFQDTNELQWDIFSKIFLLDDPNEPDDKHNIIVVYDDKQSIFSFQGSSLNVCENAVQEIIKTNHNELYSLDNNYRASAAIIDNTNVFFSGRNALSSSLNFRPSGCGKPQFNCTYDGHSIESYWIFKNNDSKNDTDNSDDTIEETITEQRKYAKIISQTIIDCCTKDSKGNTKLRVVREDDNNNFYEDNISFKDFTILAKVRSEFEEIQKALEECGIPYMQYKDNSVFSGKECADWIAILDAIDTTDFSGMNRAKFRKGLYTKFFGYTLEQINYTEFDRDDTDEISLFNKWKKFVSDEKWEDLINSIIIDSKLIQNMHSLNNLKSLGLYKQVSEYCAEYLNEYQSMNSLVSKLKMLQENSKEEDDKDIATTAISTDFDCVQLMTIHASKGLEFPIVISVAGYNQPRNSEVLYSYHLSGNHCISFEKPDLLYSNAYSNEQLEEWQRLFYVAYTRSKYIMVLPQFKDKVGMSFIKDSIDDFINNPKSQIRWLVDNGKNADALKTEVISILDNNTKKIVDVVDETTQKTILKKIIAEKHNHTSSKHAYSSLSHSHVKKESLTDDEIKVSEEEEVNESGLAQYDENKAQIPCEYNDSVGPIKLADNFPAGAGLGNAIHDVFELIDYNAPIRTPDNETLINKCFEKEGFGKTCKWMDDVYSILENVISAKMPVIHGSNQVAESFSLNELTFADRKNEVEFNFNKKDEWLKHFFNGFIDLIFKRGDYYSILDWKSDRLNDEFTSYSDAKNLEEHINDLYSIQRVLYSYCLIKWLENFYGNNDEEIFQNHFGGVYYVCIRGCNSGTGNGIYAQTWNSFADLEAAYKKIVDERVGAQDEL